MNFFKSSLGLSLLGFITLYAQENNTSLEEVNSSLKETNVSSQEKEPRGFGIGVEAFGG